MNRIPEASQAAIAERAAAGEPTRAIAHEVGVSERTVSRERERQQELIEEMRRKIQERTLARLAKEVDEATAVRLADAKDQGSRTGPQSYRVVHEAAGVIGGRNGPLVAIDQRSMTVTVEAGQLSALSGKTPAELEDELRRRMAELGDG